MNIQLKSGGTEAFVFLAFLVGIASAIFWMVVGWRAMLAHEQLAAVAREWLVQRAREKPKTVRPVDPEDQFTSKPDAPDELPWVKEL